MIPVNPVEFASPPPLKNKDIETWSKEEISQFLETAKGESISVSNLVIRELQDHKRNQDLTKKRFCIAFQDENLIVTGELGERKDPRNLLRQMDRLIKKAGIKKITFHGFRHSHATLMLGNGENN